MKQCLTFLWHVMFYNHFLMSINFLMPAPFLPKKEKKNTGFREAMCSIKNQDKFRKKICSKGLPSYDFIMTLRNVTRVKDFNVPSIWEEDTFFWRMKP